ncbi:MAG: hypothetical protein A3B70_01450 [Deltaproteobacteria bacterium RIFCSPHIGHO2_02_FULL_40_11]|nr:MAG: hypothetical protein A3B70_01450 [Deltaproteobacteria bacterium RIFCSPHIGHO2_02_FULL_40_11]
MKKLMKILDLHRKIIPLQNRQSPHSSGAALPAALSAFALRDQAKCASGTLLQGNYLSVEV